MANYYRLANSYDLKQINGFLSWEKADYQYLLAEIDVPLSKARQYEGNGC